MPRTVLPPGFRVQKFIKISIMIKLKLVFILIVFGSYAYAQIPKEAFNLSNSFTSDLSDGKVEQAVDNMIKLNELYRPFFVERMHNSLAQYLVPIPGVYEGIMGTHGEDFLRMLYEKEIPEINEEIWPILSMVNMRLANTPQKKKKVAAEYLNQLLPQDSAWGNTPRYVIMGLNSMWDGGLAKDPIYNELLQLVFDYLQVQYEKEPNNQRVRYFLSYCYFLKSLEQPENKKFFLKQASDVSPDITSGSYFYDQIFLDPKKSRNGFKQEYLNFLMGEREFKEALELSVQLAVESPVDAHYQQLKQIYKKTKKRKSRSFDVYWQSALSDKAEPLPTTWFVNDLKDTILVWEPTENWTFIDVWGTWCSPCVRELPDFQVYYDSIQTRTDIPLEIVTWGFDQQEKFDKFMEEKGYNFPIINVTMPFQKQYNIQSWPTKMLITPEGKYFKIPYGQDYKMWIKNCVMVQSTK